jgi:glycosyltransferase involved in cell wall biosynthesis
MTLDAATRIQEPTRERIFDADANTVELSVVMPCLNEAETVATCVRKAQEAMSEHGIVGEVVVADNGSTDGSQAAAASLGARVIDVPERGYGSALMGGIAASRGRLVLMGDADDSYDFAELPKFVTKLREGHDLVQGCRLASGGGHVMPGAMPRLHLWWGNPMFTAIARWWFDAPVHDVYCGMRAFTRSHYESLGQQCTGMEFATEMIIRSSLSQARIAEVPITLHPDGRTAHTPHLHTFRDGWRTLRLFLLCSPRWLFFIPGVTLIVAGLIGYAIALPGLSLGAVTFDAHTLLFASLALICGYQSVLFAFFTKVFAIDEGLLPPDPRLSRITKRVTLEAGLVAGSIGVTAGMVALLAALNRWRVADFGELQYSSTMRLVVPGVTLVVVGFLTVLASFFASVYGLRRRRSS